MDYSSAKRDPVLRNQFLTENQGFVRKVASAHCRRFLEWGRDEELSIAMIALDSAIDIYQPHKGAAFKTFASVLIKRRLIDYQRSAQRRRKREQPVDQVPDLPQQGGEEFLRLERSSELGEFSACLDGLGIRFSDLAKESPRQQRVRARLMRVADCIAARPQLLQQILAKGRLPLQELVELTGESKKVLAKRRRYLLAILVVAARPQDFPFISSYLGLGGERHG